MAKVKRALIAAAGALVAAATWQANAAAPESPSAAAFRDVAKVLASPRCMNCHTTVNWPTQGDDRHRHTFNVVRGADNGGAQGMRCTTCHTDKNQAAMNIPGAKNWRMAALSMGWTGLTPNALCKALLDPAKNGGRSGDKVIEHLKGDPLVLWAWDPGPNRKPPELTHAALVTAAETWIKKGAECPQ